MNNTQIVLVVIALFVGRASGQTLGPLDQSARFQPRAVQLQGFEYIIPELVIGVSSPTVWSSSIKLTNRGTKPIPTTNVDFFDNTGAPLRATFQTIFNGVAGPFVTDKGFSFSLGIGGILDVTFSTDSAISFGHGLVNCSAVSCGTPGLYGEVILRNSAGGSRPDFESIFPFERPVPLQYMLFDGRKGFVTLLYLNNENTAPTTAIIEVRDTSNNLLRTVTLPLGPLASNLPVLSDIAPETIGIEGTLVLKGVTSDKGTNGVALLTFTALRINPTNSFTPVRAFVPAP
jgi:hypothetical protein